MSQLPPFHLAIPVTDLDESRKFYTEVMGCSQGRSDAAWIDFNFHGHQLVCHQHRAEGKELIENPVDGHDVPVPHFGVVLTIPQWRELRDRLRRQGVSFVIEPHIRFEGEVGEQATMFFQDPSGNAIEIKAFADVDGELFRK